MFKSFILKGHILILKGHIFILKGHFFILKGHIFILKGHIFILKGHSRVVDVKHRLSVRLSLHVVPIYDMYQPYDVIYHSGTQHYWRYLY